MEPEKTDWQKYLPFSIWASSALAAWELTVIFAIAGWIYGFKTWSGQWMLILSGIAFYTAIIWWPLEVDIDKFWRQNIRGYDLWVRSFGERNISEIVPRGKRPFTGVSSRFVRIPLGGWFRWSWPFRTNILEPDLNNDTLRPVEDVLSDWRIRFVAPWGGVQVRLENRHESMRMTLKDAVEFLFTESPSRLATMWSRYKELQVSATELKVAAENTAAEMRVKTERLDKANDLLVCALTNLSSEPLSNRNAKELRQIIATQLISTILDPNDSRRQLLRSFAGDQRPRAPRPTA